MTNRKNNKVNKITDTPWVDIDAFLQTAIPMYHMNYMQVAGFKTFMQGNSVLPKDVDFIPYLNKFLNKES
jgi:hypothetical protein